MADKHPDNQPEETTVLYQNIKAICDEQRKSISQLERDSGIPAKTIANWKANRSWMIALIRVADTLEISLDKLFDRQSISEGDNHISEIMYSLKDLRLNEKSTAAIIKIAKIIALSMTEPED